MTGGLKTGNLAWVNKVAVIGFTWLFVYERAHSYEGRMNGALDKMKQFYSETDYTHILNSKKKQIPSTSKSII